MKQDLIESSTKVLHRMNAPVLLAIISVCMMALSLKYENDTYMDLWFISFVYGLIGFVCDRSLRLYPKWRVTALVGTFIVYIIILIWVRLTII